MRNTFRNTEYEKKFVTDGYVIIRNIVPDKVLDEIATVYKNAEFAVGESFFISIQLNDIYTRIKIHQDLERTLAPIAQQELVDFKHVLGTFAIKPVGHQGAFDIHQDWSLVDERNSHSISIWVPLVNTDIQNGCYRVLEKSCNYFSHPRGMNIDFPYKKYAKKIASKYMLPLLVKRGDMLVFDHRMVHDSGPNLTKEIRIAAVMAYIPSEVSACHYYRESNANKIDFYQLPENFLVTNNFSDYSQPPKNGTLLYSYPYNEPNIDFEKFKQLYEASVSR